MGWMDAALEEEESWALAWTQWHRIFPAAFSFSLFIDYEMQGTAVQPKEESSSLFFQDLWSSSHNCTYPDSA